MIRFNEKVGAIFTRTVFWRTAVLAVSDGIGRRGRDCNPSRPGVPSADGRVCENGWDCSPVQSCGMNNAAPLVLTNTPLSPTIMRSSSGVA